MSFERASKTASNKLIYKFLEEYLENNDLFFHEPGITIQSVLPVGPIIIYIFEL